MKWLSVWFALIVVTCGSGCWRPYYGRNYAPPATAPAFAPATYQQPVMQQGAPMVAQPQMMQAAPMVQQQQCVPCQPQPVCVPCY